MTMKLRKQSKRVRRIWLWLLRKNHSAWKLFSIRFFFVSLDFNVKRLIKFYFHSRTREYEWMEWVIKLCKILIKSTFFNSHSLSVTICIFNMWFSPSSYICVYGSQSSRNIKFEILRPRLIPFLTFSQRFPLFSLFLSASPQWVLPFSYWL